MITIHIMITQGTSQINLPALNLIELYLLIETLK